MILCFSAELIIITDSGVIIRIFIRIAIRPRRFNSVIATCFYALCQLLCFADCQSFFLLNEYLILFGLA